MAYNTVYFLAPPVKSPPTVSVTHCILATLAFSQLLKQAKLFSASGPLHILFSISQMLVLPTHHLAMSVYPTGLHLYLYEMFLLDKPVPPI